LKIPKKYGEGIFMNIWHDVCADRITPEIFLAVIEISRGGKNKYELDKEMGALILDRVLYTSAHYPANYGFIPRTLADDNDPMDVLVLCQEPILPMALVQCSPIGVLKMIDNNNADEKILAVPINDPQFNHISDISELSHHLFEEVCHFFEMYKHLEKDAVTTITEVAGRDEAINIVKRSIEKYNSVFGEDLAIT
jgi:inorganic pyrophosphatase